MSKWGNYYERVGDVPNTLVTGVINDYEVNRGVALDLGAGNLRDSKYLLDEGFSRVIAVDSSEEALGYIAEGIELHILPIEQFEITPETFDFVCSCNTLFFLKRLDVYDMFARVLSGLKLNGIFACNILGEEDDWATGMIKGPKVSFFNEREIPDLARGFEYKVQEYRRLEPSPASIHYIPPKFWHSWSFIARKTQTV
jgi:hypothetical protein